MAIIYDVVQRYRVIKAHLSLRHSIAIVGVLCALLVVPVLVSSSYWLNALILACLYACVTASWDISLGYNGLFNFAHPALFAIGAYTYAVATTVAGISGWIALLLGLLVAVVLSTIVTLAVIRLQGIYVALATFLFAMLVVSVFSNLDVTGGAAGIVLVPSLTVGGFDLGRNPTVFLYCVEALMVVVGVSLWFFTRSNIGLSVRALRDFAHYAASRGVPAARQRLIILAVGSGVAGLAGAVYASYVGVASPTMFAFGFVTLMLTMTIFGGLESIWGPMLGALVLTLLVNIRFIADLNAGTALVSTGLILLTIWFLPGGLWSLRKSLAEVLRKSPVGRDT